jgi:Rrf2 family protein
MRLTRQGDYAVRVMLDLATHGAGGPVPRALIQARQDVPAAYLAKIVQALARAGLVRTRPGAGGGVSLGVAPETVTLRRVIEAVEGPIVLNRCVTGPGACPRDVFCPVHPVWLRLQGLLTRELDRVTIAELSACASAPRPRNGANSVPWVERQG